MNFPPVGIKEIVQEYGDPRPYVDDKQTWENLTLAYFAVPYQLNFLGQPVKRIRAHHKIGHLFVAAFQQILDLHLEDGAKEYGGIYNFRAQRGSKLKFSTHVWGIAIDLNPSTNPLGTFGNQDGRIIQIFRSLGFIWGGDFASRKDPMHFQLAADY